MRIDIGEYPDHDSKDQRKVEIEIHHYDMWNLDHTLALIILPCLKQFKENGYGYPGEFCEKRNGGNGQGLKGWHKKINQMIKAFELILDDDSQFDTKKQIKIRKGLNLFAKYYQTLWE